MALTLESNRQLPSLTSTKIRMSSKRARLSSSFCEDSASVSCETSDSSDTFDVLQLGAISMTATPVVSNLLKMPMALLIKLTNYFSVRDFHNYTLVNRRLLPIVGRLEVVKVHSSLDSMDETQFAMTRTLVKQLEIPPAIAQVFYDRLLTMTTLENLTLSDKSFGNFVGHRDNDNDEKKQVQILSSFPKLRSLTLHECLGDIKRFKLFNPASLTHLAIEDDSDACEDGKCPFHLQLGRQAQSQVGHRELMNELSEFSELQSLSLMSSVTDADWRYPSLLHFPSLTKLHLHVESHLPHRFTHMYDLDQLPELQHLSLEFVAQGLPVPIVPGTCDCLDVLVRIKKLRTLDFNLNLCDEGEGEEVEEAYYLPTLQLIMGKIRAVTQLTSLGLAVNVPLLRKALQFLATPAVISTVAKVSTTEDVKLPPIVSLANNLRELRLDSNVCVLTSRQKEVFAALSKFTALTSLKISNLSSPPDDFKFLTSDDQISLPALPALRELQELDFTGSRSSFSINPGKTQVDWMKMFAPTLQKITMPAMKAMGKPLVKKFIEVIGTMPRIREIVLPPTFLNAFLTSQRHLFVDELRKLHPEIEFS